ncbi:MAG: hypothetical protein Q7V57_11480 [Actinomycetota bacterium]|nr:hypothetical protein [Actinomycetota bacterium]
MASEGSEPAGGTVGTQADGAQRDDPVGRFSLDDFRLRLDSPLFHRDPGVATSEPAAQLRELTWEHVVRAPEAEAPTVDDFRAQLIPAPALPPMSLLVHHTPTAPAPAPEPEPEPEPAHQPEPEPEALVQVANPPWMATVDDVLAASGFTVPTPVFSPSVTPPSTPAVEAELNRLAFLPDLEEPVGPVEVPRIATADQPVVEAAPVMPSLSEHEMYAPRPSSVAPRRSYSDLASSITPTSRRIKRHPVRRFFATVVLLGLLGGGLFAAKYYFFDQRWEGDTKALAAEVESARGLTFDHAVDVTTLPAGEYSSKLINVTFGLNDDNVDATAGQWRALGLLNGPLDVGTLGLAGIADSPAFYDSGSETIYVVEGLPADLERFALQRALTLALLDQEYGWGSRIAGAPPAVARGTRALYDADALATATSLVDDAERVNVNTQQQTLYTAFQIPVSTVPFATAAASRTGLALAPFFVGAPATIRDLIESDALITDGQALDLRRLVSGQPESVSAQSQGMLFWYHVLAARLDNDTAWRAALAWRGDDVSVVRGTSGVCVTALVQVDPAAFDGVVGTFQAWAGRAPAESNTSVIAVPGTTTGQLTVSACDPGAAIATNDGRTRLSLGGAPLRAEQFRHLLQAYPQLTSQQLACAVFGADSVGTGDERGILDPLEGWGALAAHPAGDPNAAGCTA